MSGHVIKYAIVSSDNSEYFDYWPVIEQAWNKIGITPILVHISGNEIKMEGNVITLPEIDGIKSSFQAQMARMWVMTMLQGSCLISDIDMMPLSRKYFCDTAGMYDTTNIVSYCSDAAERFDGTIPMCYILADAAIFATLLGDHHWERWIKNMADKCDQGWSCDQWYLTQLLESYPKTVHLKRGWSPAGVAFNRLDRISWFPSSDQYVDAHLLRPYKDNEAAILSLLNTIKL